jgi:hypothetical protein
MGFLTGGKPLDSVIRKRERIAPASAELFKNSLSKPYQPPDVSTDTGAGFKPRPEMWRYPRRKDGTRKEGRYLREVPRDRQGRFAMRFDLKTFAERQGLTLTPKPDTKKAPSRK